MRKLGSALHLNFIDIPAMCLYCILHISKKRGEGIYSQDVFDELKDFITTKAEAAQKKTVLTIKLSDFNLVKCAQSDGSTERNQAQENLFRFMQQVLMLRNLMSAIKQGDRVILQSGSN